MASLHQLEDSHQHLPHFALENKKWPLLTTIMLTYYLMHSNIAFKQGTL